MLAPYRERFSWDAPIHSIADIEALPYPPRMVNIKPSRLGGLRSLLDAYDYCAERGIGNYGGGQFELGVGRGQNQYLASLFHADAPQRRRADRLQPARSARRSAAQPARARAQRRRLPLGLRSPPRTHAQAQLPCQYAVCDPITDNVGGRRPASIHALPAGG